jgi:probable HAF family extracellular repeat protein
MQTVHVGSRFNASRVALTVLLGVVGAMPAAEAGSSGSYNVINLGSLGGPISGAAINTSGQITGSGYIGNGYQHAFLSTGASLMDLGVLPGGTAKQSFGLALNSSGLVAGISGNQVFITNGTTMIDLGPTNGSAKNVVAVNDDGQVAGTLTLANGNIAAFITIGTQTRSLGTLGGANSYAADMNASGQVTGQAYLATPGVAHAFITNGTAMIDLGALPENTFSAGTAINQQGQVTGYANTNGANGAAGNPHAFIATTAGMTDLGTLGGLTSEGLAINASGQVTGKADTATATHAFLTVNGTMTDLGSLGGTFSEGLAVNSKGEVVGLSYTANGGEHAFLYAQGKMHDLNAALTTEQAASFTLTQAVGINDNGQIVANGINKTTKVSQTFLLNPIPPN